MGPHQASVVPSPKSQIPIRLHGTWPTIEPFGIESNDALWLKITTMTTPEYRHAFKLLDEYSRQNHLCFVAELFLGSNRMEYVACFRPSNESINPDQFACRYLKIGIAQFELISQMGVLPVSIIEELDKELPALGHPETAK
jgi:hypothetical protein